MATISLIKTSVPIFIHPDDRTSSLLRFLRRNRFWLSQSQTVSIKIFRNFDQLYASSSREHSNDFQEVLSSNSTETQTLSPSLAEKLSQRDNALNPII